MNYRHAFHAGNFADVMKHAALTLVIEHMRAKDKPFRVIDTHAGRGVYDLSADQAERTGEWRDGVGRFASVASAGDGEPPVELSVYFEILERVRHDHGELAYPGSPLIAQALLRPQDRLHVNELHPDDGQALADLMRSDRNVVVTRRDGWDILKAALPPRERRGVVLVDPPFELAGEFERLAQGIEAALKRFATGTYLLWYPIKDLAAIGRFHDRLANVCPAGTLIAELFPGTIVEAGKLAGSGLVIVRPPYRFDERYRTVLGLLADAMSGEKPARFELRELVDEAA